MTIEDRLRRALHTEAEAEAVDTDARAWNALQEQVASRRRLRTRQRAGMGALALAAVVALVLGAVTLLGDDGQTVDVGPPVATDPTDPTSPTTTEATRPVDDESVFRGIWPFTSEREVEAYDGETYRDAEATALEFAREYLGMPDPRAADTKLSADSGYGAAVSVRAQPDSPMVTRIALQRFGGGDGPYSVIGATTDNIAVDEPASGDTVTDPVDVAGRSTAFEATVRVEVRQDGQTFGQQLGEGIVMGGASGDLEPFAGSISFDAPTEPAGAVVFFTDSARDGSVQEATVVRVGFSEETTTFSVFFHQGEKLVERERTVPKTTAVLRAALTALFEGPRPEDGADVSSFFSEETADLLADVNVRSDGTAVVDIAGTVPNANTSAGSQAFLASLDATVFQFSSVERIEYRLEGSCDAFWEWLQFGECQLVPRT